MARRIVITSGKGGVGKTTICANLGVRLAKRGKRVVMLDADIGLNNLDVLMGVENKVVYDIFDVLEGKCRIKQALVEDMYIPNLYVLPSTHTFKGATLKAQQFKKLVENLRGFDYVLIDCPAGISSGFHRAVAMADEAYVVVTPAISSLRDGDKVFSLLSGYPLKNIGLVINRIRGDLVLSHEMMSAEEICKIMRKTPTAIIPESDDIALSCQYGSFDDREGIFSLFADNIENGTKKVIDCRAKYRGLLGRMRARGRRI